MKGDLRRRDCGSNFYIRQANEITNFRFDEVKKNEEHSVTLFRLFSKIEREVYFAVTHKIITDAQIERLRSLIFDHQINDEFIQYYELEKFRYSLNIEIFFLSYKKFFSLKEKFKESPDRYINYKRNYKLIIRLIRFIFRKYGRIQAEVQNPKIKVTYKDLSMYVQSLVHTYVEVYAVVLKLPLKSYHLNKSLEINQYLSKLKRLTGIYLNNMRMNSLLKRKIGYILTYESGNPFISGAEIIMFFDRSFLTNHLEIKRELINYWIKSVKEHGVADEVNTPKWRCVSAVCSQFLLIKDKQKFDRFLDEVVLPLATKSLYIRDAALHANTNIYSKGRLPRVQKG